MLTGCNAGQEQGARYNNDRQNNTFENVGFGPEQNPPANNQVPNNGQPQTYEFPLFDGQTDDSPNFQNRFGRGFRYERNERVPDQGQPTEEDAPAPQGGGNLQTAEVGQVVEEVVRLTNEQRRENGLPELQMDMQLNDVAQAKSVDMADNDYFSHNSPTYGSPFDMLKQFNIQYTVAAENIAAGQQTAQEVVEKWMNSEGHRKNILNESVTHIGVGMENSGSMNPYWTQIFIAK